MSKEEIELSELFLSVILPIYNVKEYLERCVDSITCQENVGYEMILVDDGSTDGSGELADKIADRLENCRVIHKENGGLSSARNAGLEVAGGKYVIMIDSDDWIEPDTFTIIKQETKTNPDIFKFDGMMMPGGKKIGSIANVGEYKEQAIQRELIPMAVEKTGKYLLSAWSHVYRLEFIKSNNLRFVSEREIGSEDYLFNIQAMLCAKSIVVSDACLYDYYYREGSLTKRYRKGLFEQYVKLHQLMSKSINEKGFGETYRENVAVSFVEKFISVTLANECLKTEDHSSVQGWKNLHLMVNDEYFKSILKDYPLDKASKDRKMILLLIRMKMVLPLMMLKRSSIRHVR